MKTDPVKEICFFLGHMENPYSDFCEECGDYTGSKSDFEELKERNKRLYPDLDDDDRDEGCYD